MAKRGDSNGPRRLRTVKPGETPADAADMDLLADEVVNAIAEFKAQVNAIIDACDQVVLVGCADGNVLTVLSSNQDRHKVIGALYDALDLASTPSCTCGNCDNN